MKKRKSTNKFISYFMSFIFMLTLINVPGIKTKAEEGNISIASDAMAVLTGDFLKAQGLGSDWAPDKHDIVMKEFHNGVYMAELDFKSAGDFSYKIAMNGSWDENYGKDGSKGGDNISLKVDKAQKVNFLFDYKNKKIFDSINNKDYFKKSATLVGNLAQSGGKDWVPSELSYDLDYIGNGFYKKVFDLKAGNYEYKVAYNHDWNNGEIGSNIAFKLDKDSKVTILANPYLNLCVDSINNMEILNAYSIIGDVRDNDTWEAAAKGYELDYIGHGKFIYTKFLSAKEYGYKACVNYSWDGGGIPGNGNASLKLDKDKYVVFVVDAVRGKIYDSVNNPEDVAEALGLQKKPSVLKSPVINANGTVTFNYKDESAEKVYLAGSMTDWQNGKKLMTKDKQGVWSITLRLGDEEKGYEYKFIAGDKWVKDPLNDKTSNDNSLLKFPKYEGRKVVIAGTIQGVAGENNWTPSSDKTKMTYKGKGLYELLIKNVPAGKYEYKVAMGSWDPENYGLNGKLYGDNISLVVDKPQDITFFYNDDSHLVVDSISYKTVNVFLKGSGIEETKLTDDGLTGIYSAKLNLKKGVYEDLILEIRDDSSKVIKTIKLSRLEIKEDSRLVTLSYDPVTEMGFNDASSEKINTNELYFNSKELNYKKPFGAVKSGEEIAFNLKAGKDKITLAKMVINTPEGTKVLDMSKDGSFDADHDRWTLKQSFYKLGNYKYYFIVTNGSDIKAYGDDDGFLGEGKGDELGKVKPYEFNIYKADFKTPDWMKHAVVYQIFPDRFFNGDNSNDYLQKYARGIAPYEFYEDWYAIPENPNLAYERNENGNFKVDKDGKPVVKEGYKGTVGDGYKNIWCNEMYGGDLKGINQKLDYLQSLGVNVLYLNPISKSISNHRYDTTDYREVDPLLGHMDDFVNLSKEAKIRGMHVILDGVYNHVSDDSIYFDRYGKYMTKNKPLGAYQYWSRVYDIMNLKGVNQQEAEKQVMSDLASKGITDFHYKDWFRVENEKVDEGKPTEHYKYEGWWGYDSMPVIQDLKGSEYNVETWADEIIDGKDSNTRYWLRQGSNGWRLDVANEVSDETWQHFRTAVKEEGDNVIIGEIWTDASKYLLGDMYDSVMNYRFREAVLGYLRDNKPAQEIMNQLELIREQYPEEAFYAMMNLVDSHDTERILTSLDGVVKDKNDDIIAEEVSEKAKKLQQLVPLIQMTYAGAPCIYYGDEAGMVGAKDPDNRRAMVWGKGDKETVETYAKFANLRNNYEVLRTGKVAPAKVEGSEDVLAYERYLNDEEALVVMNRSEKPVKVYVHVSNIANGSSLKNALTGETYTVSQGKITLNLKDISGVVLVSDYKEIKVNVEGLKDAYDSKYIVKNTKAPKTDEGLVKDIKEAAKKGQKEALISNIPEEISSQIINACKENNIKPVIRRGNVTFTVENPDELLQTIKLSGNTGLILKVEDEIQNQEAAKILKNKFKPGLFKELNIENNLLEGKFNSKVKVSVKIDSEYNGRKLYVYYIDKAGNPNLVEEVMCKDGNIEFAITHCSDYVITDKPLIEISNENEDIKHSTISKENVSDKNKDKLKKDLPKTGETPLEAVILFGLIVSLSGVELLKRGSKIK